jgi:hypothetical protein
MRESNSGVFYQIHILKSQKFLNKYQFTFINNFVSCKKAFYFLTIFMYLNKIFKTLPTIYFSYIRYCKICKRRCNMKKLVGILAAMAVMFMVFSSVSFAQRLGGGPGAGYEKGYYGSKRAIQFNPATWAYGSLLRASNNLVMAKGYASNVEDGKTLISKAEKYYNTANSLYNGKNYVQAFDYAIASSGLSKAIIHLYRAKNPTALPSPPPVQ